MITAEECLTDRATSVSPVASVHRGGLEVIERWAEPWRELCDDAVDDQPFYCPEWIAAHIGAFTPRARVVLITITAEGRLSLVLPLLEERSWLCGVPVRKLRAPVNGHSCRFDAVRRLGLEEDLVIQSLWQCLKKLPGWDVLEFEGVPAGTISALASAAENDNFRTGQVPMSPNPYVPVPRDLSSLTELPVNRRLRSKLRAIRRELANQGELRLRRIGSADEATLRRFYELESAGWKGTERTAIASSAQCLQFYSEIAQSAEKLGHLCLYQLEFNDQLLAAHFGLVYKGRYFSPKVTYKESFGHWAPGHLMVDEILRDCVARGVREYDITGQNDDWKRKWTDRTRGQCIQYIFRNRVSGRVAHQLRFFLRPRVKKIVERIRSK